MPRTSVIIPAYNPGIHIKEAIESVYKQTFTDWELIVIDDGSPEDLSWIQEEYPKVKYVRQENSGVSVARNAGIINSNAEFIAFLDQDDLWLSEKLAHQIHVMDKCPQIALCYTSLFILEKEDFPEGQKDVEVTVHLEHSDEQTSSICRAISHFKNRFCVPSTVMIRRQCLSATGLLDPFLPFTGDYELLIRLGSKFPVGELNWNGVGYRVHENNFSNQYEVCRKEIKCLISKYRGIGKLIDDEHLYKTAKRLFTLDSQVNSAQAFDRGRKSFRDKDLKGFATHMLRAAKYNPGYVGESLFKHLKKRLSEGD